MTNDEQCIEPQAGELWRHFKGGTYRVVAVATEEDTGRLMVVYKSLADGSVWCRTMARWMGLVSTPQVANVRRFVRIDGEAAPALVDDSPAPGPTPNPPSEVPA